MCITWCFFVQPTYIEGQSRGTGAQGSAADALANMDAAFNNMDSELTPEDAYYLGRAVAANILTVYKPYTQKPEMTQYLNRICQTLAINSSQPTAFNGYHVIILDSPEFNALATSGGHIFVTKGLVELTTSEDMLAAIIAHELAHIILHHSIDMINEMKFTSEMSAVGDRAMEFAGRNSASARRFAQFRDSITKTIDTMLKNGYSQSQEFDADKEAMALLFSAGYDPAALTDILKALQRVQRTRQGGFNTTHPSPGDRLANVEKIRYRNQDTRNARAPRFKSSIQF